MAALREAENTREAEPAAAVPFGLSLTAASSEPDGPKAAQTRFRPGGLKGGGGEGRRYRTHRTRLRARAESSVGLKSFRSGRIQLMPAERQPIASTPEMPHSPNRRATTGTATGRRYAPIRPGHRVAALGCRRSARQEPRTCGGPFRLRAALVVRGAQSIRDDICKVQVKTYRKCGHSISAITTWRREPCHPRLQPLIRQSSNRR